MSIWVGCWPARSIEVVWEWHGQALCWLQVFLSLNWHASVLIHYVVNLSTASCHQHNWVGLLSIELRLIHLWSIRAYRRLMRFVLLCRQGDMFNTLMSSVGWELSTLLGLDCIIYWFKYKSKLDRLTSSAPHTNRSRPAPQNKVRQWLLLESFARLVLLLLYLHFFCEEKRIEVKLTHLVGHELLLLNVVH